MVPNVILTPHHQHLRISPSQCACGNTLRFLRADSASRHSSPNADTCGKKQHAYKVATAYAKRFEILCRAHITHNSMTAHAIQFDILPFAGILHSQQHDSLSYTVPFAGHNSFTIAQGADSVCCLTQALGGSRAIRMWCIGVKLNYPLEDPLAFIGN